MEANQIMTQHKDNHNGDAPFDPDSYEKVILTHAGWVYHMARRELVDASLADDAVQAIFLVLWQRRKRVPARNRHIGGWLVRATYYVCREMNRCELRRQCRERKAAIMRTHEPDISPETSPSNSAQLAALDAAMQKLSVRDRNMLVARFFQNRPAEEAAQEFNISEAAAARRTARAVGKLRRIMAGRNLPLDNSAVMALLAGGDGNAPNGLIPEVLRALAGHARSSLGAECAARRGLFHAARVPAIFGVRAAAVTAVATVILLGVLKFPGASSASTPAQVAPPPRKHPTIPLPAGIVLSPQGKPVPRVNVFLANRNTWALFCGLNTPPVPPPKFPAFFRSAGGRPFAAIKSTTTDSDGNFIFPPQKRNYLLIVDCLQGFAEIPAASLGAQPVQIALQPWCQVDVNIKLPTAPGITYGVGANPFQNRAFPSVNFSCGFFQTRPGYFTCSDIPGVGGLQVYVGRYKDGKAARNFFYRTTVIFLQPGQHAKVDFGGTGCPVAGKILLPASLKSRPAPSKYVKARLVLPTIPYPQRWFHLNHAGKINWLVQWFRTPAGHIYQTAALSSFIAKIRSNGLFRMAAIPPGNYHLQYLSTGLGQGQSVDWPAPLAAAAFLDEPFTVPNPPGGFSGEAVDLGKLEPALIRNLRVGDIAPPFALRTAGGSVIRLSDFKGKVVLLYLWDWPGIIWHDLVNPQLPTLRLTEMPELLRIHKKFGKNPNFVMISVATDNDRQLVRQYLDAAEIPWLQATAPIHNRRSILDDYSYRSFTNFSSVSSVIYLIGSDGKIAARNPQGKQIIAVVAKALAANR